MVHFNSIKVQLELRLADDWYIPSLFQFHKGTIRTIDERVAHDKLLNFNSIKVQLEPKPGREPLAKIKFQFHKGTIRTYAKIIDKKKNDANFNSIKVQLEHCTGA